MTSSTVQTDRGLTILLEFSGTDESASPAINIDANLTGRQLVTTNTLDAIGTDNVYCI